MQLVCLLTVGMYFKNLELPELLAIVEYFLFAVLVALYEEPEKPNSALEYPFLLFCELFVETSHETAVLLLTQKWRVSLRRLTLRTRLLWMHFS